MALLCLFFNYVNAQTASCSMIQVNFNKIIIFTIVVTIWLTRLLSMRSGLAVSNLPGATKVGCHIYNAKNQCYVQKSDLRYGHGSH